LLEIPRVETALFNTTEKKRKGFHGSNGTVPKAADHCILAMIAIGVKRGS